MLFYTDYDEGKDIMEALHIDPAHPEWALLRCSYDDRHLAKSLTNRTWEPSRRCWRIPATAESIAETMQLFPRCIVAADVRLAADLHSRSAAQVASVKSAPAEDVALPILATPYAHQIAAYQLGCNADHVALLMEQGTGKTLTAIAILGARFLRGEVSRALVVCPASVCAVWSEEFLKFAGYPVDARVLTGTSAKKAEQLDDWQPDPTQLQVAVVNYESIWRIGEAVKTFDADIVVCDESQRIKTASSAQSKFMHRLAATTKHRMILTGTPVSNHPTDFFRQYKFLDPRIFGNSFTAFRSKYCNLGGFEGREIVDYRDLDGLIRKAHSVAFRVTKADALDLPEQIDTVRYCELPPASMKVYRQMRDEAVAELDSGGVIAAPNVLTRLLRLQQMTGGFIPAEDDEAATPLCDTKLRLLAETVDEALERLGGKVVIFARFKAEIKAIRLMLEMRELDFGMIWGATPMGARGGIVEKFQTDPDCRVFIAQIQSAGLGITLTAADTAVFYSLDFSFANYDQARARLHRIGQQRMVNNIHLIARGTIDEAVLAVLKRKRNIADAVVDGGWRDLIDGRADVSVKEFAARRT